MTSANSQQTKNKQDTVADNDELKRLKKNKDDESINTKNFIRKMTAKKSDNDQKAQNKITKYMNMSSNIPNPIDKDQNLTVFSLNGQQTKIRQLEERMKQKDLEIQKMKRNQLTQHNKYSNLFLQNKQYKKKSRMAIAKSMLEAAQYRRNERRQINPKLGYFKDGRYFIEGSLLTEIKNKIKQKQDLIRQHDQQRKIKDHQKKQRAIFKVQFLQKEIQGLTKQLEERQVYVNLYKERLRLADKQSSCQYALQGWPIVFENYQTLQLLGKGGFGQVYKSYDLQSNQIVALKVNRFNQDSTERQEFIKHVTRQAEIMKKLNHPNVGKFLTLLECTSNKVVFTLQYCSGPQLSVYLKKHQCLQEKQAKQVIKQLFSALKYLSSLQQKVIHYDLKPGNIMFHNGLVKILDFGLCKPMGNQQSRIQLTSQGIGTYWYLPPETFNQSFPQISPKVDVWSVGVIFFELLYGRKPFGHGVSQNKIYNEGIILNSKKVEFPTQNLKKYKVSEAAKNFIKQCLNYDPQIRLSPTEACDHQYFKK